MDEFSFCTRMEFKVNFLKMKKEKRNTLGIKRLSKKRKREKKTCHNNQKSEIVILIKSKIIKFKENVFFIV